MAKGVLRMVKGGALAVKILGKGKIANKLTIENCITSKTAKEAIEKAGGTVK
jgi:ribosomal protein L15